MSDLIFSYKYGWKKRSLLVTAILHASWVFIILLENGSKKISFVEWLTYGFSIVVNAYATYLFFWTDYVQP